jgi:hypothetical protein
MRTRLLAALALPLLATACASSAATTDAARAIVIQVTLIAGAPSQSLSATWEQTPDSPGISAPIADTVQLWLINDAHDSAQFVPATGIGSYSSSLPVLPGRSYHLRGAIGRTRINDSVTLPGGITITAPAAVDTITVGNAPGAQVELRWSGDHVSGYGASEIVDGQPLYLFPIRLDTSVILSVPYRSPASGPTRIRIFGFDARLAPQRTTNDPLLPTHGVIVILGSAVVDSVIVVTVR